MVQIIFLYLQIILILVRFLQIFRILLSPYIFFSFTTFKYLYVSYHHMINKGILQQHPYHSHVSEQELFDAYKIFFGTLVSESRLNILNLLRDGKKNVSELMNELRMDQTAVSHDLARLRRCGFVLVERDGKFMYYSLNKRIISPLLEMIDKHMSQYCIHILRGVKLGGKA